MSDLKKFQQEIGYEFQKDELLLQALTHSSYANEKRMPRLSDNERLEFLGDAVLELVTSEFLYHRFGQIPEGDLTKKRASIVCEQTLTLCAKEIQLGQYLLLGRGEDATGGRQRKSILSDAMEAVIGAIFLDGGLTNAKEFIHRFVLTDIESKELFYDSKTILQEFVQGNYEEELHYAVVGEEGPDHAKIFTVEVRIGEKVVATGEGSSKKAAEQEGAYNALLLLKKKG